MKNKYADINKKGFIKRIHDFAGVSGKNASSQLSTTGKTLSAKIYFIVTSISCLLL